MRVKRYSQNEPLIFLWVMLPYCLIMDLLIFGSCLFSSLKTFLAAMGMSLLYFALIYAVFGLVATLVRKRYPQDGELFRRIGFMLLLFYMMNLLSVQGIYIAFEKTDWVACEARRRMEWWVSGFACLASTIITFANEAAVGWEKWKSSITETGRLQNAYQKSRLLSLRRQINPHFLFNCFNTLSSLIQEDEEAAEKFLDEMTKVYRYLLKGDDEQLVSLEEELKFIESYLYLGKIRFGSALDVEIRVNEQDKQKQIAPMTLQVVLQNIIYRNAFSKSSPIYISVYTNPGNELLIRNTVQPKAVHEILDFEEALDDLVNKYRLLCKAEVRISETAVDRQIIIPLIEKEEVSV